MRTLRIVAFITILAVALPFAVLLRPAHADTDGAAICKNNSEFMRVVAVERDKGLKLIEAIRRAHNMLMQGHIQIEQYPITIAIIHDVYNNPKRTPVGLAKQHEVECLKAYGIVGI